MTPIGTSAVTGTTLTGDLALKTGGVGNGMSISLDSLTPGVPQTIYLTVDSATASYTGSIVSGGVTPGMWTIASAGMLPVTMSITFTPSADIAALNIVDTYPPPGPHHLYMKGISLPRSDSTVLENVVTLVCDEDRYHYGYNGQMKVNEIAGIGNHMDFKYRGYDARTGRFSSPDPVGNKYPWNGSYNFAEDRVIVGKDLEGKEWTRAQEGNTVNLTVKIQVVNQSQILDNCVLPISMQGYLDVYKAEAEKAYSAENGGRQYRLNIEFTDKEAPFKLVFTDETPGKPQKADGFEGRVDQIGNTQQNTIYIRMGMAYKNGDLDPGGNSRDMVHSAKTFAGELGHTGWLLHPDETQCDEQIPGMIDSWNAGNEMNNVMNHKPYDRGGTTGMEVRKSQQEHIDNKVKVQQKKPQDAKGVKCETK